MNRHTIVITGDKKNGYREPDINHRSRLLLKHRLDDIAFLNREKTIFSNEGENPCAAMLGRRHECEPHDDDST